MDTLGALALATEIPSDALLHRKPYRPVSAILHTQEALFFFFFFSSCSFVVCNLKGNKFELAYVNFVICFSSLNFFLAPASFLNRTCILHVSVLTRVHSLNLFVLRLRHCYPASQNSPLLSGAMWRHVIVQASLQLTLLAIATSAKGSSWMSGAPQGTSAFVHVWGSSSGGSGSGSGSGPGDEEACSQDVHRNTLTFAVFVACQVRSNFTCTFPFYPFYNF